MTRPPNVVLVNCDDLGYGDLGCYGSKRNASPTIDRLAANGARFTNFYMASPVCSPSRAALLCGCYPLRVGFGGESTHGLGGVLFPGWDVGLNPAETTIAAMLSGAGYATLAVGKWHCGDQPDFLPTNHGFDEWYGLPYSNDMGRQRDPDEGLTHSAIGDLLTQAGIDAPWTTPPLPLMDGTEVIEAQPDQSSLTERYVERCVRFMRTNAEKPFFVYLAHMYVHLPIYVQQRFLDDSVNGPYGAAVACIDWATDVITHELERLGLSENTLVIFTSDNGALSEDQGGSGSNAPLRGSKGTTWEGGMRVPCVMSWPGRIPAASVIDDLATSMDLLPTIASLSGASLPDRRIDGADISSLVGLSGAAGPPLSERSFFFTGDGNIEAVRRGRWKLHVRKGPREITELYDLMDDPGESRDSAADRSTIVAELLAEVEAARRDLGDEALGIEGSGVRSIGRVAAAVPLTEFDASYPYYAAEYDLPHRG
ncbi:MAG: sulfatase family protein [Microthrixaceae bacterium]